MEPVKEIKRIFPKCNVCGTILAQCSCAAARNEFEALSQYMTLRDQASLLEQREDDCECGDFYTCDLCREMKDINHSMRGLMELWGDNWATRLAAANQAGG